MILIHQLRLHLIWEETMSNEIYNEAIRIINERKIKAERDAEERKLQLEEKIPEFSEINEKLSSTNNPSK